MHPTYFFTCLTPDDFTSQQETLQLNGLNRHAYYLLKAQVNERSDAFYNKFKELISIQYCTFIILSVVVVMCVCVGGGGGVGVLFFRIHVKGVIGFFCDAGGGAGYFV